MSSRQLSLFDTEPSSIPAYHSEWRRGIHYVFNVPPEDIQSEPFEFGNEIHQPGDKIVALGTKPRARLDIGKPLIYAGRKGALVFFSVDDDWWIPYHIVAVQVSPWSLHMLSGPGKGWDITVI